MNQERIDNTATPLPERRHLRRLDVNHLPMRNPVYFITMASYQRKKTLTHPSISASIQENFKRSPVDHGWAVGQYVIMPDHVHFFCRNINEKKTLSEYIRDFKRLTSRDAKRSGVTEKLWQPEFFDHALRSNESYGSKREYVRLNPVRAGLVKDAGQWPWQGVCEEVERCQ